MKPMTKPLRIDFVSDISCPWCVIGLGGLEQALDRLGDAVEADIHLQPFELNPDMPFEGADLADHLARKGMAPEQLAASREALMARGAEVGLDMSGRTRIFNTFDAHRLLHWAQLEGRHLALKRALFAAYFADGENPADQEVLMAAARRVGLDAAKAREVLETGAYAEEVRQAEAQWRAAGINSVPAVVVNQRYLISGGQPADVFEQALRQIAAEAD